MKAITAGRAAISADTVSVVRSPSSSKAMCHGQFEDGVRVVEAVAVELAQLGHPVAHRLGVHEQ